MQKLKVLLFEANADDARLILDTLAGGGYDLEALWVNDRSRFVEVLSGSIIFDLVLAGTSTEDLDLDGASALALVRESHATPFIVLSGVLGEEVAVEMLKRGAKDVVLKHRLGRLVPAVRRALQEVQEVKERCRIEQELQRANRRFQQASELVNAVIYEWDLKTGNVLRSPSINKLLGYEAHEIPTDSDWWRQQVHPDDWSICADVLKSQVPGSKIIYSEYRLRHANGHYIYVCDRAYLEWDGDEVVRMLGITEDISQHKAIEETLRKAKEAAEAANNAKSMFLANMSHEIRTPLGAILGFAELCLAPDICAEDKINNLKTIKKNGALLSRIIDDILDLSKVEAGKIEIEMLEINLIELIYDVLSLMSVQAEAKGLRLRLENEGVVPVYIRTDPVRLRQILLNIIGNAIKFTEEGEVLVLVQWQPSHDDPSRSWLQFEVKDTGVGMRPEQLASIFKLFSQSDTSTTRRFGGTGLGLVLARRLAQALNGDVSLFKSEEGKGSVFRIIIDPHCKIKTETLAKLNFMSQESQSPAQEESTVSIRLDDVHVLLVDDVIDNLVMIRMFLQRVGAKVTTVRSGREALLRGMEDDCDVILMDIQMPEMDGHQAVSLLRRKGFIKPIIALTAHAMSEEKERCLESGFSAYLTKPIEPRILYDEISRHVSPSRGQPTIYGGGLEVASQEALDPADFGLKVGPRDRFVAELIRTDPELREIHNSFLRNLHLEIDQMRNLFYSKNLRGLRDRVHAMRGSAGNYGFVDLFAWASKLEQELSREADYEVLLACIKELDAFETPRDRSCIQGMR